MKTVISCNNIGICKKLEVLLWLKLSGYTDTQKEASNLIGEMYKKGAIQKEQKYGNALDIFHAIQMELASKFWEQTDFNTESKIEKHMLILMDNWSELEVLLGFKIPGPTDTLTEASNLLYELCRKGEIQND